MERPHPDWRRLEVPRDRVAADEWTLVLSAANIQWRLEPRADGWDLSVPADDLERATAALAGYAAERSRPLPAPVVSEHRGGTVAGIASAAVLLVFFAVVNLDGQSGFDWMKRGSGTAHRIVGGEWWRIVTALTLHAHLAHVAGNAAGLALFGGAVCRWFGPGVGLVLILAAGAGGNAVNALFRGTGHSVIGASTAVFGAVGLLSALQLTRRFGGRPIGLMRIRRWAPLAGGLALLALLGTSETSDIGAHLFGFAAGIALGFLASGLHAERLRGWPQGVLALGAVAVPVLCWWLALR